MADKKNLMGKGILYLCAQERQGNFPPGLTGFIIAAMAEAFVIDVLDRLLISNKREISVQVGKINNQLTKLIPKHIGL